MRILVTGGSGFVGAATIPLLKEAGHEVFNYDIMEGWDIRNPQQIQSVFETWRPERVLHLAAIARFSDADKNPRLAFETNVIGTMHLVKAASKNGTPFVYASTGSAYMPLQLEDGQKITEDMQIRGNSVYGCTKALGDLYVQEHTPHIVLRYAHLYGKEKRGHGLIGGFLDRIDRGLAPTLYGGKQSNDFTYILDVARANLLALEASWDRWNQVYNCGTGEELTAEDAGRIVCDAFGYTGDIEVREQREVDASRFVYDMTKAKAMLGFVPQYDFKAGMAEMKKEMGNA